jgi:S-adenosyl-L-methionine hydrolase (adenosine-forming)
LTSVFDEHPPKKVVELTERRYARPSVSRTFEGRDRFAPAAAWLAKGTDLSALGRAALSIHRIEIPVPIVNSNAAAMTVTGQVLRVDRFGNLVTNIDRRVFDRVAGGPLEIRIGDHPVTRVVSTYADANAGEVCALFGSTDHLEVATNGGSAADTLSVGRGVVVTISRVA